MSRSLKNKLVECIAVNLSKEKYGDKSKKDKFLIEAEELLKTLLLQVLVEKAHGDPLDYITFLENVEELCDLDYYDVWFLESIVFGEWKYREIFNLSFFIYKL